MKPNKAIFTAALMGGSSIKDAATSAGVRRETGSRWLADDPEIDDLLEAANAAHLRHVQAKLNAGTLAAIDALLGVLEKSNFDTDKITAARAILDYSQKTETARAAKPLFKMRRSKYESLGEVDRVTWQGVKWNAENNVPMDLWKDEELTMFADGHFLDGPGTLV